LSSQKSTPDIFFIDRGRISMTPCDAYSAEILRYLDNDLHGQELDEFRAHIDTCEACRTNLVAEKALSGLFHRTRPLYPAPSTLRPLVRATLLQHGPFRKPRSLYERVLQILEGMLHLKAAGGIPVGLAPDSQFASRTFQLETNDVVVAYTDGITEAQNRDGDFWGQQKLEELLLSSRHKAPQQIIEDILNKLTEFVHGHAQRDDMTLVVMRVQGGDARL